MKLKILVFLLFPSTACFSQVSRNCEKLLDKTPYFVSHQVSMLNDSVIEDLRILAECGKFDSIDRELLNPQMLGVIIMSDPSASKELSYRSILKRYEDFKLTKSYTIIRNGKLLETKVVDLSNWESDKQVFVSAGMPEAEIEKFKAYLDKNIGQKQTYKQAFAAYTASEPKKQVVETSRLAFPDLGNLEQALKQGKENKKVVLIYFTCYACANARKMEEFILTKEEVKTLLSDHFAYFSAYVDSKQMDATTNETIGSKYIKLQQEKFKYEYQPYFVIVDENGNEIASSGYTNNVSEFLAFLKKGIK